MWREWFDHYTSTGQLPLDKAGARHVRALEDFQIEALRRSNQCGVMKQALRALGPIGKTIARRREDEITGVAPPV